MSDNISLLSQIILHPPDTNAEHPIFTVDDGVQPPVTVMCKERKVLVATFSRLLLTRIGQYSQYRVDSHHGSSPRLSQFAPCVFVVL